MTPAAMTTEALTALAAMRQDGTFTYERNENYDSHKGSPIQGHVIRYTPHPEDLGNGTTSHGLSFPAVVATDWMGQPEETLAAFAEQLNAAPALAAELLTARSQTEALTIDASSWKQSARQVEAERNAALARVRVLEEAIVGLTPSHRNPAAFCWCPRHRNLAFGHLPFCTAARAALNQEAAG